MALTPAICDYLRELARKLDAAPHGGAGLLLDDAGQFLGMSRQTIYRHLKAVAEIAAPPRLSSSRPGALFRAGDVASCASASSNYGFNAIIEHDLASSFS